MSLSNLNKDCWYICYWANVADANQAFLSPPLPSWWVVKACADPTWCEAATATGGLDIVEGFLMNLVLLSWTDSSMYLDMTLVRLERNSDWTVHSQCPFSWLEIISSHLDLVRKPCVNLWPEVFPCCNPTTSATLMFLAYRHWTITLLIIFPTIVFPASEEILILPSKVSLEKSDQRISTHWQAALTCYIPIEHCEQCTMGQSSWPQCCQSCISCSMQQ